MRRCADVLCAAPVSCCWWHLLASCERLALPRLPSSCHSIDALLLVRVLSSILDSCVVGGLKACLVGKHGSPCLFVPPHVVWLFKPVVALVATTTHPKPHHTTPPSPRKVCACWFSTHTPVHHSHVVGHKAAYSRGKAAHSHSVSLHVCLPQVDPLFMHHRIGVPEARQTNCDAAAAPRRRHLRGPPRIAPV
jgi:hypothetical protein